MLGEVVVALIVRAEIAPARIALPHRPPATVRAPDRYQRGAGAVHEPARPTLRMVGAVVEALTLGSFGHVARLPERGQSSLALGRLPDELLDQLDGPHLAGSDVPDLLLDDPRDRGPHLLIGIR